MSKPCRHWLVVPRGASWPMPTLVILGRASPLVPIDAIEIGIASGDLGTRSVQRAGPLVSLCGALCVWRERQLRGYLAARRSAWRRATQCSVAPLQHGPLPVLALPFLCVEDFAQ